MIVGGGDIGDGGGFSGHDRRGTPVHPFGRLRRVGVNAPYHRFAVVIFGGYRFRHHCRGKHKTAHCHKRCGNKRPFRQGDVLPPGQWTAAFRNKTIGEAARKMFNPIKVVQCTEQRGMCHAPPFESDTAFGTVRQMIEHPSLKGFLYPTVKHVVEQISAFLTVHFSLSPSLLPKTSANMSFSRFCARFRRDFTVPTGTDISSDISDRLLSSK